MASCALFPASFLSLQARSHKATQQCRRNSIICSTCCCYRNKKLLYISCVAFQPDRGPISASHVIKVHVLQPFCTPMNKKVSPHCLHAHHGLIDTENYLLADIKSRKTKRMIHVVSLLNAALYHGQTGFSRQSASIHSPSSICCLSRFPLLRLTDNPCL